MYALLEKILKCSIYEHVFARPFAYGFKDMQMTGSVYSVILIGN